MKSGYGWSKLSNGEILKGIFKNDFPVGDDVEYIWPCGDRYEGEMREGVINGFGTWYFRNGNKYIGEFKEG